jgi:hypothetical protein
MSLIIVIGAFGSGKSEYAINLARSRKDAGETVSLVDLDIVNPYFRSRDVEAQFEANGIEVVCPKGQFAFADLPMISPRIRSVILDDARTSILDVGGDPAGCRSLGRFRDDILARPHEMRMVINTRRPFTADRDGILSMQETMEKVSGLKVTHYVCNTNLMEYTTAEIVGEGLGIVRAAAEVSGIIFEEYTILHGFEEIVPAGLDGLQRTVLRHYLLKPWEEAEA